MSTPDEQHAILVSYRDRLAKYYQTAPICNHSTDRFLGYDEEFITFLEEIRMWLTREIGLQETSQTILLLDSGKRLIDRNNGALFERAFRLLTDALNQVDAYAFSIDADVHHGFLAKCRKLDIDPTKTASELLRPFLDHPDGLREYLCDDFIKRCRQLGLDADIVSATIIERFVKQETNQPA